MNKAALYRNTNLITRCDSKELLFEFSDVFNWRSDGHDSLIDAGCGPGDVTSDIILPMMPYNFERLVGIDVSKEMIDFARETQIHPKVSFELFNLDLELENQSLHGIEPVDHLTSFFCLMWVRNQRVCLQNFYKLLKPGGDMLLVFMNHHVAYDAYMRQSQDTRWAKYTHDYAEIISPYHKSTNVPEEFDNLLKDCGFSEYYVREDAKTFIHDGDEIRNLLHSVNPFIDRIPAEEKEAYLDDLIDYFVQNKYVTRDSNNKISLFNLPYTLTVAFARK